MNPCTLPTIKQYNSDFRRTFQEKRFWEAVKKTAALRNASVRSNTIAAGIGDGYGAFVLYSGVVPTTPDRWIVKKILAAGTTYSTCQSELYRYISKNYHTGTQQKTGYSMEVPGLLLCRILGKKVNSCGCRGPPDLHFDTLPASSHKRNGGNYVWYQERFCFE